MANIKSAKKRIRQIERRSAVNRTRLTRMRTHVKQVEQDYYNIYLLHLVLHIYIHTYT